MQKYFHVKNTTLLDQISEHIIWAIHWLIISKFFRTNSESGKYILGKTELSIFNFQ